MSFPARCPVSKRQLAVMMLLLAAFFWGTGNVAAKNVLDHVDPFTAVAIRSALAALVILPFLCVEKAAPRKPGWLGSATLVALAFTAAQIFQQVAYRWTSVTNVSFLVNLCAVLTPVLAWVLWRERQPARVIAAAFIVLVGASLMAGFDPSTNRINPGDLACFASAICYAAWMLALGRHAIHYGRPFGTCFYQFATTAVLTAFIVSATQSPTLSGVGGALPDLIVLGVFSTAAAFVLQTHAQRYLTASTAAVLTSAESLFGAVAAAILLGERLTPAAASGACLIFGAILLVASGQDQTAPRNTK